MSNVIKLFAGRAKTGRKLPKPRDCDECEEPIEAARLQVEPHARLCVGCQQAREARHKRMMAAARDDDVVIVRTARFRSRNSNGWN